AAIRLWLAHAEEADPKKPGKDSKAYGKYGKADSQAQRTGSRSKEHPNLTHHTADAAKRPSHKRPHLRSAQGRGNDARNEKVHHNTAEELGLHAPFRSFASRGADERLVLQNNDGRRKRRRSPSTASSSLKPAVQLEESDDESKCVEDPRTYKTSFAIRKHQEERPSSPILVSEIPEQPTKIYERRKRHKTREDRYELKEGAKRAKPRKSEKEAGAKPKKKKKRIQKSGSALMQDFNAGNVQPDRLTVSPSSCHARRSFTSLVLTVAVVEK
ncbi:MAG: hypothetical protein Q9183_005986, partial [Haloplaca sp. 2 TL-2023]